jgi:hypothetical protein
MFSIRPLLFVAALAAVAALVSAGCRHEGLSSWEKERLEARTADDLDSTLDELVGFSTSIADADAARGTFEIDRAGYAGCTRSYLYEGNRGAGTVDMELVGVPCSASLTLNDVRFEYTISEWAWSGSWTSVDADWWDVEWSGASASALVIDGSERNDGEYDSSFTMNGASARTDGDGNLAFWSIDYSYAGFLGREWDVVVAKDEAGAVTGSITSNDGVTCVVSGQDFDYVIDCD